MKAFPGKLVWVVALIVVAVGILAAISASRTDNRGPQLVAETRQTLRQQGFKTDLADFDFSTSAELQARQAILNATVPTNSLSVPFQDHPNLMEAVGTNSAVVVWELPRLKKQYPSWPGNNDKLTWEEFRKAISSNSTLIDAACAAILSGPIVFDLNARDGVAMRLPHLAMLKNLTQTLGSRMVLDLHNGNLDAAWTNLIAATRLVTAWQTEPVEISQLVRFGSTTLAYNATWQALQANGWSDEQLVRLQWEWESADFFTNLPETTAYKRVSDVAFCLHDRREFLEFRPTYQTLLIGSLQSPRDMWRELLSLQRERDYFWHGMYQDQTDLLLFYRDRELEIRNAVQAPTWLAMCHLPGATNKVFFQSKSPSRIQSALNLREMNMAFLNKGASLLGRAAEAEAQRRILITAIALERYRGKYGSYPNALAKLVPEFLKSPPVDFMDGQPLRYHPTDDGHFILYSVGLDCVDHGGTLPAHEFETSFPGGATRFEAPPPADIVWPLPASAADVAAMRQREERAEELWNMSPPDRESEEDWQQSPLRLARVEKILAMNWTPSTNMETFAGRRVVDLVGNGKNSGTNQPSLAELLIPKQIITGGEPENLTFDLPVSYEDIIKLGALVLLVDGDPKEPTGDSGGRIQDCNRAGNGDCLLVWHTIFDPPGRHAVQVQLVLSTRRGGEYLLKGPAIPVATTNFCQFSLNSATYDVERGAIFHARLPETNGLYTIECLTTNGEHLKTLSGSTSNGEFNVIWNLVDDHGHRLTGETFNSIVHITLPDSGRTQTLRGP